MITNGMTEEQIINALKSYIDKKFSDDKKDNEDKCTNKMTESTQKHKDNTEKEQNERQKRQLQDKQDEQERQLKSLKTNNQPIQSCIQTPPFLQLPPSVMQCQAIRPPLPKQFYQPIPKRIYNTNIQPMYNQIAPNVMVSNGQINEFVCCMVDLDLACKFCAYRGKHSNHELKYCSFICTNEQCLGEKAHPKFECRAMNRYKIDKIEYNVRTFIIHKFMLK